MCVIQPTVYVHVPASLWLSLHGKCACAGDSMSGQQQVILWSSCTCQQWLALRTQCQARPSGCHMVLHSKVPALMHVVRLRVAGRVHYNLKAAGSAQGLPPDVVTLPEVPLQPAAVGCAASEGGGDERAAAVCRCAVGLVDAC